MKKNASLLICLLQILVAQFCVAQDQHKIDSVRDAIGKHPAHDTTLVNTLNFLAEILEDENADSSLIISNVALKIADSLQFKKGIAHAYMIIGINHGDKGDVNAAIENYRKSINILVAEKYFDQAGSCFMNVANQYRVSGAVDSVLQNYELAKKYFSLSGDNAALAAVLVNQGSFQIDRGNLEKGLEYLLEAQKILEQTGQKRTLGFAYVNIAMVKNLLKDNKQSEDYTKKAITIFEQIGDKNALAGALSQMGDTKTEEKKLEESIVYFRKGLAIGEQLSNKRTTCHNLGRIGNSYLLLHKLDSANFYFEKSLASNSDGLLKEDLFESHFGLGNVRQEKKEYKAAYNHYKQALNIALEIDDRQRRADVYKELSNSYMADGNDSKALEHYKKYNDLKDSILNEEKVNSLNEMTAKFESEKKENQITILTKDNELKNAEIKKQRLIKNYFIGGLVAFLLISILVYRTYRTKQLLKLQTLRNRIAGDLHDDVGSTLSSISIFSEMAKERLKGRAGEIEPMLESIGESSRKMLESMADIVWTINPENDNFEKIILRMRSFAYELLNAREIDFEFTADDAANKLNLPMDARKNLYLIFKEATNNLAKYSGANKAAISITMDKNNLAMLIRDNGKGFDVNGPSAGNGLKSMRKRAEEIGGRLLIESESEAGTTIQLSLNVA